jgi:hypothetical protein
VENVMNGIAFTQIETSAESVRIRNAEHRSARMIGVSDGAMLRAPVHSGLLPRSQIMKPGVFMLLIIIFCGCAQTKHLESGRGTLPGDEKLETRNNAASLLHDLLGNEKNVSKILIVKSNSESLGRLIKAISEQSADYQKQLDGLASNDVTLNLRVLDLPPGEKAARAAAAKTDEHELLFSSGKEFEFNLLLTQAEALSYGGHLAVIAAKNSSLPKEVHIFNMMSQIMNQLHDQVIVQMNRNN